MKISALLVLALVASIVVGLWYLDTNRPKRNRYLIPEGYKGWLCITYDVPSAQPLISEDGFKLVRFDSTGKVETSDKGESGKLKDEFYFYSQNSLRPLNYEKEMGGGFTTSEGGNYNRYTYKFWVSQDAKNEQPPFSLDNTPRNGGSRGTVGK